MVAAREFATISVMCSLLLVLSCSAPNNGISHAEESYRSGVNFQEQGRLEEAIVAYDEAILLDPDLAAAYSVYNNRGRSYAGLGQHELAIPDLDEAIRINPQYAAAYNNRGRSYAGLGQPQRAIDDFDLAIRLNPEYAAAYNNRSRSYAGLGQHGLAVRDLDEAIRMNASYASTYNNLGFFYDVEGKHRQAIEAYYQGVRRHPENAAAYNNRGQLGMAYANRALAHTILGKPTQAQQDRDVAVRLGINKGTLESAMEELTRQR